MIGNHLFGACLPVFGDCADRFVLSGYGKGGRNVRDMLDLAAQVENLDGVELVGNWHVNDSNVHELSEILSAKGLKVSMVAADLWTQSKWGRGGLAAPDSQTRQAAIDEVRRGMDWAVEIDCPYVDVWPGQDGYDYCFQADYPEAWKWLRDGLVVCAAHNPAVRILVEYKPKEPRTHCFIDSAAKALLLLEGIDEVGVLLDVGHAFAAGETPAAAASLLSTHGKLDYLHLNDNYRSWDDDMMVGSVHLVEYLELVYWLKRVGYKGWLTLDVFPYREDGVRAATECRKSMEMFFRAVDRVGMDAFGDVIERADACDVVGLVRRALEGPAEST